MNKRIFKRWIIFVILFYFVALVIGIMLKKYDTGDGEPLYNTFKDLLPLIVAIPVVWLGYCFHCRLAYLRDVRELWSKIVVAVQEAIQYTHLKNPSQSIYGTVLMDLSIATEELRAIFINIGEGRERIGLYPYESIKTIHAQISCLSFGTQFTGKNAKVARHKIVASWKEFRKHYLNELERSVPTDIDSPFFE